MQLACHRDDVPEVSEIHAWLDAANEGDDAEVLVRVVDEDESASLNKAYRHKTGATNVLSFPFEVPEGVPNDQLGDIVICAAVVCREAAEQGKSLKAHWAHMVVHGMLHLQGYDHVVAADAEIMENKECCILHGLGYADPYSNG